MRLNTFDAAEVRGWFVGTDGDDQPFWDTMDMSDDEWGQLSEREQRAMLCGIGWEGGGAEGTAEEDEIFATIAQVCNRTVREEAQQ